MMKLKIQNWNAFFLSTLTAALLALLSPLAHGYQSVIDTGDVLPLGTFRTSAEVQFAGGDFSGTNELVRLDAGVNESSNVRAVLGTGSMGFDGALFYKYIPVPDIGNQPALGLISGFEYGYYSPYNEFSIETRPIISKRLHTLEAGIFTPYAALPVGVTFGTDRSRGFLQLAIGTFWQPENVGNFSFFAELGFNVVNAFDSVSFAAAYTFGEANSNRNSNSNRSFTPAKRPAPPDLHEGVKSHDL